MGSNQTKPLYAIDDDIESRSPEQLKEEEDKLDQVDRDAVEQFRVIHKYLEDDEIQYAKDVDEYRKKNNVFVITDRDLLRRAEGLIMRKRIVWH
jgi:uncharacterized protein YllA (UPF0747 family)